MKGSKFIAVLFSWNYKVRNCYELLLQGRLHPIYAREVFWRSCGITKLTERRNWWNSVLVFTTARLAVGEFLFPDLFWLNSWIKFEKRTILDIWKDPNSLQCFLVEITKLGIAMNCSYRECTSYLCSWGFLTELRDNEIDGKAELMEERLTFYHRAFGRWRISFSGFILAKFLNKVWEKDYFGYMKGSKFIAVLFSWNYKVRNCYELLLQGRLHPIYAREVF